MTDDYKVAMRSEIETTNHITMEDVVKCYSQSSKYSFFNKLVVYFKKGAWLEDTNIDNYLKNSKVNDLDRISAAITNIHNTILSSKKGPDTHNPIKLLGRQMSLTDLKEKEARLQCAQKILSSRTHIFEAVRQREVQIPTSLNMKKPEEIQQEVLKNVEDAEEEVQEQQAQELIEVEQRVLPEAIKDLVKIAEDAAAGYIAEQMPKETVAHLAKSDVGKKFVLETVLEVDKIIAEGVSNLNQFVQNHLVASNTGHRVFQETLSENRQYIERLDYLNKVIPQKEEEIKPSYQFAEETEVELKQLEELKEEKAALENILAPVRTRVEQDKVGDFVPTAQNHIIEASQKHFSKLPFRGSQARTSILQPFGRQLQGLFASSRND